jgi:MFS family permease
MTTAREGSANQAAKEIETDIPSRMDRLRFSRFHILVIAALGVTWILDGLEVTIVGSIGPILQDKHTLSLSSGEVGIAASSYVFGAVSGALGFGWLTDRLGRRAIFNVTLGIYLLGVLLTACSWNAWSFSFFRVMTGIGIGGEYASVNSAIDELIPARLRGRIDMAVNGSFWFGAAAGAAASLPLLGGRFIRLDLGWRLGFGIGAVLGCAVIYLRRFIPESPRWLVTHDREEQAKRTMNEIERQVQAPPAETKTLKVHPKPYFGLAVILSAMWHKYRARSGLVLTFTLPSCSGERGGALHLAVGGWEFSGTTGLRAVLRFSRPSPDDYRLLRSEWFLPGLCRRTVWIGGLYRLDSDSRLDGDLFRCVCGGKFGLHDCERDLPSRDTLTRYRRVLRIRDSDRRDCRSTYLRAAHQHWTIVGRSGRLYRSGTSYAGGRRDGTQIWRRCRGQVTGECGRSAFKLRILATRQPSLRKNRYRCTGIYGMSLKPCARAPQSIHHEQGRRSCKTSSRIRHEDPQVPCQCANPSRFVPARRCVRHQE